MDFTDITRSSNSIQRNNGAGSNVEMSDEPVCLVCVLNSQLVINLYFSYTKQFRVLALVVLEIELYLPHLLFQVS